MIQVVLIVALVLFYEHYARLNGVRFCIRNLLITIMEMTCNFFVDVGLVVASCLIHLETIWITVIELIIPIVRLFSAPLCFFEGMIIYARDKAATWVPHAASVIIGTVLATQNYIASGVFLALYVTYLIFGRALMELGVFLVLSAFLQLPWGIIPGVCCVILLIKMGVHWWFVESPVTAPTPPVVKRGRSRSRKPTH